MNKYHLVMRPGAPQGTWAQVKTIVNGFLGAHTYERPVFSFTCTEETMKKFAKGIAGSPLEPWTVGPVSDADLEAAKALALGPAGPSFADAPAPAPAPAKPTLVADGPESATASEPDGELAGDAPKGEDNQPTEFDRKVTSELKAMLAAGRGQINSGTARSSPQPTKPGKTIQMEHTTKPKVPPSGAAGHTGAGHQPPPQPTAKLAYDGPTSGRAGVGMTDEEAMSGMDPHDHYRLTRALRASGPDRNNRQWFRLSSGRTYEVHRASFPDLGTVWVAMQHIDGTKVRAVFGRKWPECIENLLQRERKLCAPPAPEPVAAAAPVLALVPRPVDEVKVAAKPATKPAAKPAVKPKAAAKPKAAVKPEPQEEAASE